MDIVLIILSAACLLVSFLGCFLPVLPGTPIAYLALWLLYFTDYTHLSLSELIVYGILVILVEVLDFITPMLGAKYSGGTRWGNWGCVIGTLIGIVVFPPLGIIFGPFVGAFIGEILGGKGSILAFKAGIGAFIGFFVSVALKISLCGYFLYCFLKNIF